MSEFAKGQAYALDVCVGLMRGIHDNDPSVLCPDKLGEGTCSLCTTAGLVFDVFGWEE